MHLNQLTITQTAKGLKDKKFSSVEVTKACLNRIETIDKKLHAFLTVTKTQALKAAKEADELLARGVEKPLLGIPLAIKDNFCTKEVKTTASSNVLKDFIPPYNATVIERLENAGMVMLGKTNMDAWAHGSSTETSDFGPTKNPWNTQMLPGGSSGGSAAAVASDETIAAIGSETAGSIRQPANWCGIVGLKPTYGRVSRYGVIAMASSTDSPGPMTKTVEDGALLLEILAGKDPKDATTSPLPVKPFRSLMKNSDKKYTIGISDTYFEGVDPEVVKTVQNAIKVLEKLGHTVRRIKLFNPLYAIDVYTILQRSEVSSNLARFDGIRYGASRDKFGEEAKRRIMLGTYALSAGYYDAYYLKALKVRTMIVNDFNRAFETVDAIIAPTSPSTALPLGSSKNHPMFGETSDILVEPSSIAGLPGINMPVGFSNKGLPIGMQIMSRQFTEEIILSLALQYEQKTDWGERKPEL